MFSYINFLLGYLPLLFNDIFSQVILVTYVIYVSVTGLFSKLINSVTKGFLLTPSNKLGYRYNTTSLTTRLNTGVTHHLSTFFTNTSERANLGINYLHFFSKNLSQTNNNLNLLTNYLSVPRLTTTYLSPSMFINIDNLMYSTLKVRGGVTGLKKTFTEEEFLYIKSPNIDHRKVQNTQLNLNWLNHFTSTSIPLTRFNFNIIPNMSISKQQRWLVRNSLLNESVMSNSFLLTQTKKLLGSGLLDKNFSNKTLWLPTKLSKMSSSESVVYLNNLTRQLTNQNTQELFLGSSYLTSNSFKNLNFFENSRLWLFKK